MALTDKLSAIGAAIREKGGTTELLTLDAMPDAIAAIQAGGGEDMVPNPIILSGDQVETFSDNKWEWILNNFKDRILTKDLKSTNDMFQYNTIVEEIPFDFNYLTTSTSSSLNFMFSGCHNLKRITGKINYYSWYSGREMFSQCFNLRELPVFEINNFNNIYTSQAFGHMFAQCYSLRSIPSNLISRMGSNKLSTSTNALIYSSFNQLSTIDEIVGIPTLTPTLTSNAFDNYYVFKSCYRLKRILFNTKEDGSPYVVNWKNQTIDLSQYCGWAGESNADKKILNYNSGITAEDEDSDWSNNPNYWSKQFMNSRFNHDSAVEFINTLPDTSAYVAAQNAANNAVKFYTNAGSATPGGGVNALTEEEIAVAAAKGWSIGYTT